MSNWLVDLAHWLQNTRWALKVSGSDWAYPYVQATHFTGLSMWVGSNVLGDLRIMGFGKKYDVIGDFWNGLIAWNWIGFAIAVSGGFLLFSANAVGYVKNPAFEIKIAVLFPVALVLHVLVQCKTKSWTSCSGTPILARFIAFAELLLWSAMIMAAIYIPEF